MILRKSNVKISGIEMAPNHNSQSGESMEAFNHTSGFSSTTTTHISGASGTDCRPEQCHQSDNILRTEGMGLAILDEESFHAV
jgi:hypothetical protein